jgi:hypothetical protein
MKGLPMLQLERILLNLKKIVREKITPMAKKTKACTNYSEVLVDCLGWLKMLRGQMMEWVPQREPSFEADLLSEQLLRMRSLK